tara:strand:- start:364 stop:1329 length:966 start_codon:yes stop_codon:yes gene_type:complete
MTKKIFLNILTIFISVFVSLLICEFALRLKHKLIFDYDLEQWKYSKKLKIKDENKKIGHTHIKNSSAILQGVDISINNFGQRDIDYDNDYLSKYQKKFLFIGSSITLGWGVDYDKTFINHLNKMSKQNDKNWIFINGGIGNYNVERYVNNYFANWSGLDFTDIVVQFFVNDTEVLSHDNSNFLTRNFHTGVVLWKYYNSLKSNLDVQNIKDYYVSKYNEDYEGFIIAKKELKKLSNHCTEKKLNCHLILMPDIHQLDPYELKFINKKIKKLSNDLNFNFFDLLPYLEDVKPSKLLWNDYNDPHPNVLAHEIMGKNIYTFFD